jgi:hypothetical protein
MKKQIIFLVILATLVLGSAVFTQPAFAGTNTIETCEEIYFYLYNGAHVQVFADVTNWNIGVRWLGYLNPGQDAKFSLPFGGADGIEFWVQPLESLPGNDWYLSDWIGINECSYVAAYIKVVKGPQLKILVVTPE